MEKIILQPGPNQIVDDVGTRCMRLFQEFLEEYKEDNELKYEEPVKELLEQERNTLEVSFEDIEKYNQNLATAIIEEYYRLYSYLCQAVTNFFNDVTTKSKMCYVSFTEVATRHKVRELTTTKIGTLLRISGQVIRTHPVHPELVFGTFICLDCQTVIPDVEQQFKFTNPTICRNPVCSNRRRFMLDVDKSTFLDFQKVRIQENQSELPRGCIPRSVEVILRAENVETVQAGDRYDFTGTLIVVPDVGSLSMPGARAEPSSRHKAGDDTDGVTGIKALGVRELYYRMAFLCCSVQTTSVRFGGVDLGDEITADMMRKQMTEAEWNNMYEMSRDRNLYQHLMSSLFPSIHGNEEVKRGILLMLFGGVSKTTMENTSLRGDINCCIVGDPSTAKSQFLKQVSEISPRAVYTSGKASSAAGLTAAVVKDEESSDFVIEAGALMLADHGICCIDEFDKMDLRDQVAIHEAMEQQTITIAKAGVRATLNARTSILAAANPIGGRYDRSKSLHQNLQLSSPIMSRFDLFFILLDECNEIIDYAIARKIVDLHCNIEQTVNQKYSKENVLQYIAFARKFKPIIGKEAAKMLVNFYSQLRMRDNHAVRSTWRITVRQLESMIRLAEAMAKMEISDVVKPKHVKEAYRLLDKSIIRVEQPDINLNDDKDAPALNLQETSTNVADSAGLETPLAEDGDTPEVTEPPKKKFTLTFEEYKNMTDMIIVFLRNEEVQIEEGRKKETRRSHAVAWYLTMKEDQIETEDELIALKEMTERVMDRLMYHDQIIIPLTAGELNTGEEEEDHDPVVVVHPNYICD